MNCVVSELPRNGEMDHFPDEIRVVVSHAYAHMPLFLVSTAIMDNVLLINVWIIGTKTSSLFTIDVHPLLNVSLLKDKIKERSKPLIDHTPASGLSLWKVCVLSPQDFEAHALQLNDDSVLYPTKRLGPLFPNLDEDSCHIMVRVPEGKFELRPLVHSGLMGMYAALPYYISSRN